jgi:protein-tyrosine phosphatase
MRQLAPHLWIGHAGDARNLPVLHEHGIRAVVDLAAEEPPAELSRDLLYFRIPLTDDDLNEDWLLRAAVDTTVRFIQENVPVLVACSGGMSRSPLIVAAALSNFHDTPIEETLKAVLADGPRQVSPGLWESLSRWFV